MAPSAEWTDLSDELERWGDEGRIATLWWRDDDAVACSGRLGELFAVANGVPMALAVIPALAEPALAEWLGKAAPASTRILQHGWQHADHAGAGKKSEFPRSRSPGAVALDLMRGRERLTALFGSRALAVLAPPWNRFDDNLLPLLAESGIGGISRINPRDVVLPDSVGFREQCPCRPRSLARRSRVCRRSGGTWRLGYAFAGTSLRCG